MSLPTIFCPKCETLILDAASCPDCDWRRPAAAGAVGQPAWAVALEAKLPRKGTRPTAAGGFVCIPTDDGQILAVDGADPDPENPISWQHDLDQGFQCHAVAVWDEYLLAGAEYSGGFPTPQGALVALAIASGEEVWRHPVAEGTSLSVPAVHEDGVAFFTANTGWLYAVDLAGRQELWGRRIPTPWSWAPAAPLLTGDGLLVLPSRGNDLVAVSAESGEEAWRFPGGGWFPHTPAQKGELVLIRCWDQHVYGLDAGSGRQVWRHQAPRDYSSDVWVGEDYLYMGAKDFEGDAAEGPPAYALYTLDWQTGERVSRHEVVGHIFARPVATEEAVFFATDDRRFELPSQGTFYALGVQGERLLWEPYVVEQRFQSDLVQCDDLVIAATRQGAVYAMRWRAVETDVEEPQAYAEREQWEEAAIAHALGGELVAAAEICHLRLERPYHAAQLYQRAGDHQTVLALLSASEVPRERELAIQAVQAVPEAAERARVLREMGEHAAAAKACGEASDWEGAGDCYREAQLWQEALDAYQEAKAWGKWEALSLERDRWEDVAQRWLEAGRYAEAGEEYLQHGYSLEAADCFDQAGTGDRALAAYRQVSPDKLTADHHRRVGELAAELGEIESAIEAYQSAGKWAVAAELAEAGDDYQQALTLYQKADDQLKCADMLENMARHAEAADLLVQLHEWGRAAENWEAHVERAITDAGGVRHVRVSAEIQDWLDKAIEHYEDEANEVEPAQVETYHGHANRCRVKLMQIRGEPILELTLQAQGLIVEQGNAVRYVVHNVGWGGAEDLSLSVRGDYLRQVTPLNLGSLVRHEKREGKIGVVPDLCGEITLEVELQGRMVTGDPLRQSLAQTVSVVRDENILHQLVAEGDKRITLNIQNYVAPGAKSLEIKDSAFVRSKVWDEGTSPTPSDFDTGPIPRIQLKEQMGPSEVDDGLPEAALPAPEKPDMRECPECGEPVWGYLQSEPDAKNCPHCGARLRE